MTTDLFNGEIYSGVTGFRLKYPSYSENREWSPNNTEWIEITKRKNKLPTVKLRTYVLYYRNDGKETSSQQPPGLLEYNYRFYSKNTNAKGRQIGWFWGFPLFKVNENNWPLWKSCIGSTRGFEGSELQNIVEYRYEISFSTNDMTNFDFDKVILNKDYGDQHNSSIIYLYHVDKLGINIDASMNIIKSNISNKDYLLKITDISNNFSTFKINTITQGINEEYWTLTVKNIKNSGDNNLITQGADVSLNFIESETLGNEKMLVDLSKNKNMIVLDFSGYSRTPPLKKVSDSEFQTSVYLDAAYNDISRNFSYQTPVNNNNVKTKNFYLTLRIKKSTENNLSIHFNPWNNNQRQRTRWCSLVEYVYDCDIIYPTDMLDLMYNKFLYKSFSGNNIRFFGEEININNKQYSEGLAPIITNTVNTYTSVLKFQILTGLGPDDSYASDMKNNAKEHTLTINAFNFATKPIYANDIVKKQSDDTYIGRVKTTINEGTAVESLVVITDNTITQFPTVTVEVGELEREINVVSTVSTNDVTVEPTHEENYADYWTDTTRIMSINQIKNSLIYTENNDLDIYEAPRELQQVDNYKWNGNTYSGNTITKMIGGFYSDGSDNTLKIGYYGDNYSEHDTNDIVNDLAYTKVDLSSNGWRWDISFNVFNTVDGKNNNLWISDVNSINNGTYKLTYDLNNILWCSLRSSRKSKQLFKEDVGNSGIRYRFITNYLDLSGNDCIGGGYGLHEKTIDLPRTSIKPYYSNIDGNNLNTTSILNYVTDNNQQYFTDNEERQLNETQTFKVAYKLLVPPSKDKSYKINYTFGKDISSVVTFFRFSGMDGTLNNDDKTSKKAIRATETIELEWNDSSLSSDGEMPIKYIYLTDIASGSHNIDCSFNISDLSLNYINKYETRLESGIIDISKSLYDISSNIFQLRFIDNTTSILPVVKEIEENNTYNISIKTIPENYIPYRYQNVNSLEGINLETQIFDDSFFDTKVNSMKTDNGYDISNAPIFIFKSGERYNINLRKVDVKNNNNNSLFIQGRNNNITNTELETIENYTSINVPSGIYDISRVIIDNTFNITSTSYNVINGDFVIFKKKQLLDIFTNKRLLTGKVININQDISYFTSPQTDNVGNYFISDYWALNKQINLSRNVNVNNYTFLSSWENQSQIAFAITYKNLSLREKKIDGSLSNNMCRYALINSNENITDINSNLENEFIDDSGEIISKNNNIVFDIPNVVINTNLNEKPIIIQFISNTIFGDAGIKFFGNTASIDNSTGITKPILSDMSYTNFKSIFIEKLMSERDNFIPQGIETDIFNNLHDVGISTWDDDTLDIDIQNNYCNNIDRRTNITALIVNLPNIVHLNSSPSDMISRNNISITLKWSGFDFSKISNWNENNLRKSDVQWLVERTNVETSEQIIIHSGILPFMENYYYTVVDDSIILNDTYKYKVSGNFVWEGIKTRVSSIVDLPFLKIEGFETNNISVCKFNRFTEGRFNTTSTNKKLFPNDKNIYANTADTMTKKQTYVRLLSQKTRPDR